MYCLSILVVRVIHRGLPIVAQERTELLGGEGDGKRRCQIVIKTNARVQYTPTTFFMRH